MEYGNGKTNQLVWKQTENRYHNASFDVDEDNLNVNIAMLSKYVQPGEAVLDVGCGEGKLGILLRHKKCTLYGIDLDQEACKIAQQKNGYEKVFRLNIEQGDSLFNNDFLSNFEEQFDTIAIIDVLEHMVNPTKALLNLLPFAKDEAHILVSVPNLNNADVVLNLLNDHFNYQEAGILDNTHTKFYTRSSFFQWIAEINDLYDFSLDCLYVGSTFGYTEFMELVAKEYPNLYNIIQSNPYFHVIQHLFVLTLYKQKDESKLINLKKYLKEEPANILDILENSLTVTENEIKLLPNERFILEEQIRSANLGWKNCFTELKHAGEKIVELEDTLKSAESFQQKQSRELQTANKELETVAEKKLELEAVLDEAKTFQQKQERDLNILINQNKELFSEKEAVIKREAALSQEFLALQAYAVQLENDIAELKKYAEKLEKDIEVLKK